MKALAFASCLFMLVGCGISTPQNAPSSKEGSAPVAYRVPSRWTFSGEPKIVHAVRLIEVDGKIGVIALDASEGESDQRYLFDSKAKSLVPLSGRNVARAKEFAPPASTAYVLEAEGAQFSLSATGTKDPSRIETAAGSTDEPEFGRLTLHYSRDGKVAATGEFGFSNVTPSLLFGSARLYKVGDVIVCLLPLDVAGNHLVLFEYPKGERQ